MSRQTAAVILVIIVVFVSVGLWIFHNELARTVSTARSQEELTQTVIAHQEEVQKNNASEAAANSSKAAAMAASSASRVALAAAQVSRIENIMREMTMPTASPGDTACINEKLGIRFNHPESWGACACDIKLDAENKEALAICGFAGGEAGFGALSESYVDPEGGRGLSTVESVAWSERATELPAPIISRELPTGETIPIWHNYPVGWDTEEYVMAFRAPTKHRYITVIGFVGPRSSSSGTTLQDVHDFLLAAYTYQLLP